MNRKPAKRRKARAAFYAVFYPCLVRLARRHGYALTIHGSLHRDCDLVAVPWRPKASAPFVLVKAIERRAGGIISEVEGLKSMDYAVPRPHGRLCWSIHFGSGAYLDISVTPRKDS